MQTEVIQSPITNETTLKAPQAGDVKQAIANQLRADERQIASLQAEIERLKKLGTAEVRVPVSEEQLNEAIAKLENVNAGSIKGASEANPPVLDLSLSKRLGFNPLLTPAQRKDWGKRRDAMRQAFSTYWKAHFATVRSLLNNAVKNPRAILGARISRNKLGEIDRVAANASKLAKSRGKVKNGGKKAKPAQVAGKIPAVGNQNPPAKV